MIQTTPEAGAIGWASPLDEELRARALDAALLIARRCTDPASVREAIALAAGQTHFPLSIHWLPTSVAQGEAGLALLCAELQAVDPDGGWDRLTDAHTGRVVQALAAGGRPPMGTVGGSSGLALLVERLHDRRLTAHLPELRAGIAQDALTTAASIRGRSGLPVSTFDLISGLSGVLLCALPQGDRPADAVAPHLTRALTALARGAGVPPAWYTPPDLLHDDDQRRAYPHGHVNLGLAHGMPGPLAAMSLAVAEGVGGTEAESAVETWADWLVRRATVGRDGPGWDSVITLEPTDGGLAEVPPRRVGRDAWCYGTPGAARALFLAGRALDRHDWQELAIVAMAAVYRRPPAERAIDSPTFCHGVAGLLQVTLRFHHDTGRQLFADAAAALTRQILDAIEPDRPMAIANLEPGDNKVDQPGLLDGAAGVSLVLLAAASEVEPTWDRMFGLA